ncbi:carboxylesterase/lipase family protein [Pantoea agglomerans]|uniref:carboxylesterase/lipase family protein n=1 Tax=Enterobacter agglomerans TaxID=549 RepID=UPI0037C82E7E
MKLPINLTISVLTGAILGLSTLMCYASKDAGLTVATSQGNIQGFTFSGMRAFRGIPYAQPPVGSLRWKPPVPVRAWIKTFAATSFGHTCATHHNLGGFGKVSESEDCLYLNVYTPENKPASGEHFPVMIWIHGGGLGTGSGDDYDASKLVRRNVVVVTFNYRLGLLGFFSNPAINAGSHPAVNYGTLDQQAALKWVRDNIEAFGGDKHNVTLFGESAGGHSVMAQIASPRAKGLFNKAIVSSGAYSFIPPTLAEANNLSEKLVKATQCNGESGRRLANCLRALPIDVILDKGVNYLPIAQVVTDGDVIPTSFTEAFTTGNFNRVPVINGFNSDEGTFFAGMTELMTGRKISLEDYQAGLMAIMGDERGKKLLHHHEAVLKNDKPVNLGADYASFLGRAKFICSVPLSSDMLSKYVPVYTYEFADKKAHIMLAPVSFPYGASHTAELQYIFKDFHGVTGSVGKFDEAREALSDEMVAYWTNFAKTSNPNGAELPLWTVYKPQQGNTIKLVPGKTEMENKVAEKYRCDELRDIMTN